MTMMTNWWVFVCIWIDNKDFMIVFSLGFKFLTGPSCSTMLSVAYFSQETLDT